MKLDMVEELGIREAAFRYAAIVMRELAPHFEHPWRLDAQPQGSPGRLLRIDLRYSKEGDPLSKGVAVDLWLHEGLLEIPKIGLPQHLHHRGLMIHALGRLTDACEADGVHLVISDLVDRYKRSLLKRGAVMTPNQSDAVILHKDMNFVPFALGNP